MKQTLPHISCFVMMGWMALGSSAMANEKITDISPASAVFLKVGLGYTYEQTPYEDKINGVQLFVNGRYQMENGLFVEAAFGANKRNEGLNIGYNFYNTENWHFDVTTIRAFGEIGVILNAPDPNDSDNLITTTETRDKSEMLGLRATGTYGRANVQFLVAPILLGNDYDDGIYSSMWAGHSWQLKNWEFYLSAGLEYRSEEILDYYFEITNDAEIADFPTYDASSGIDATLQISASYPISKNLIFESYLRYQELADSITDSPIIRATSQLPSRSEARSEFGLIVSYVF